MSDKCTIPPVEYSGYWEPEDVRAAIKDRRPGDNPISGDLDFTDADIILAMRHMAAEMASVTPMQVGNVHPSRVPFQKFFLDGIIANLYDMEIERLARNEYQIEGGGTSVDLLQIKRKNLQELSKQRRASFLDGASRYKLTINLSRAWRSY